MEEVEPGESLQRSAEELEGPDPKAYWANLLWWEQISVVVTVAAALIALSAWAVYGTETFVAAVVTVFGVAVLCTTVVSVFNWSERKFEAQLRESRDRRRSEYRIGDDWM